MSPEAKQLKDHRDRVEQREVIDWLRGVASIARSGLLGPWGTHLDGELQVAVDDMRKALGASA